MKITAAFLLFLLAICSAIKGYADVGTEDNSNDRNRPLKVTDLYFKGLGWIILALFLLALAFFFLTHK